MARKTAVKELNEILANFYDKYWRHPPKGKPRRHAHISFDTLEKLTGLPECVLVVAMQNGSDHFHHVFGLIHGRRVVVNVARGMMGPADRAYYASEAFTQQTVYSRIL